MTAFVVRKPLGMACGIDAVGVTGIIDADGVTGIFDAASVNGWLDAIGVIGVICVETGVMIGAAIGVVVFIWSRLLFWLRITLEPNIRKALFS